ncbi:flavin reductase family protein [Paeniglutamicibacter sulfureus]|jgi:flavin reductase (DIM6/NTAB) family NADH-FMN oxidoreductase RutF|uniref:Flavin reductase family protein n=1 Tax=Paeniglutamicibacter gangotriensis TaxID=254787 RepID=A0A5B0EDL1_9MICC|nr:MULTISPECIES: flavin reductase family protein [Paeniglutamicibacter]KAA0977127.1 flavin reductase family protein [Paeniglutamicibacter gangotriensis]MDO2934173.1 flavin reductase family protein [Paeniglutamicibacter sulfureus]
MTITSDLSHTEAPTEDVFRSAMANLPSAVSIVTTFAADGTPHGATVSAVSSLSMSPPLVIVCLDAGSETLAALEGGRGFLIHIVADGQQDTAFAFAKKGREKFERTEWVLSDSGQPKIPGAAMVFDCQVADLLPGGDHTIVVGRIVGIDHPVDRTPVIYHRRHMQASPAN